MSKVSAPKEAKKNASGTVEATQKVDYAKKIREGATKVTKFLSQISTQVIVTIVSIVVFSYLTTYFGLSLMGGLAVFGGIALGFWGLSKFLDGSANQEITKVTNTLKSALPSAQPQAEAA